MWSGTSEQSISNHCVSGTSEPVRLSTSGMHSSGTSDLCTNEIMWDKIEPFSDHCEMSFASDVMPLSGVSETSNYVQAQFDASNASHSTSDMPVDSLVGCSADVVLSSVDRGVQIENDNAYVNVLLHRIDALESQNELLKSQFINAKFSLDRFSNNDDHVAYYTGFKNFKMLMIFWRYLGDKVNHLTLWHGKQTMDSQTHPLRVERTLRPIEEFFLCLVRLRLCLQVTDLAFRFSVSSTTVSRIFTTWINFLYLEFKAIVTPPTREQIDRDMPTCFKTKYPTTRLIIDATEIPLETPSSLQMQSTTWSTYKNTNTLKGLIGITPSGYISFVSSLYCGNVSDKKLTSECGVLKLLQAGDSIMADRGFDIADECAAHSIELNIPPFRYM